jgi:hypothetical protein
LPTAALSSANRRLILPTVALPHGGLRGFRDPQIRGVT